MLTVYYVIFGVLAAVGIGYGVASLLIRTAPLVDENERPVVGPGLLPVDFPERNVEVAKDQDEYRTLPAFVEPRDGDHPYGFMITCWQMSRRDRIKLLLTGKLWAQVMTFHQPVQPLYFSVNKSDVLTKTK